MACKWWTFFYQIQIIIHKDVDKILYVLDLKSLVVMIVQSKLC